jgi:hypothetical protein
VRKAINDNPLVQVAVLGTLAVIVGFMLLTRLSGGGSSSSAPAPDASAATTPTATTSGSSAPSASTTQSTVTPSTPVPSTATDTVPPTAPVAGVPAGKLVAGPGLPKPVANAYADGKTIVLLVFRHQGIDDAEVREEVEKLRGNPGLAVFVVHATQISEFSRIAEGVNADRVPALIVVKPKRLSHGTPTASIDYGFRSADSVQQAIRDALYKGRTNLPYYPR